jgi:hypothetical protein
MTYKKGKTIYIKCNVGITEVISGYKCVIERVNKKEGQVSSLRVSICEDFNLREGFTKSETMPKRTFQIAPKAYQFFENRKEFVDNIYLTLFNAIKTLRSYEDEVFKFS